MIRTPEDFIREQEEEEDEQENFCACISQCEGCTARSDNDCDHFIARSWYNMNVP